MGHTQEMIMAMTGNRDQSQIGPQVMICYNCGQFGHRSEGCTNAKNFDLVVQVLRAQGRNTCDQCGCFGHQPATCWMLPQNAHLRPPYWRGVNQAPETTNWRGHYIMTAGNNWRAHGNAQEVNNNGATQAYA
jgi:Zinc knuckle